MNKYIMIIFEKWFVEETKLFTNKELFKKALIESIKNHIDYIHNPQETNLEEMDIIELAFCVDKLHNYPEGDWRRLLSVFDKDNNEIKFDHENKDPEYIKLLTKIINEEDST